MEWNPLPGCCGVAVISDLDSRWGRWEGKRGYVTSRTLESSVKAICSRIKRSGYKTAIATTIIYQTGAIEALRANGFEALAEDLPRRHGKSTITLWRKTLV